MRFLSATISDALSARMGGIAFALFSALLLAACASRPGPETLDARAAANIAGAKIVTLYLATSRQRISPERTATMMSPPRR